MEFHLVDKLDLNNLEVKCNTKAEQQRILHDAVAKIQETRIEVEQELEVKRQHLALLNKYSAVYPRIALRDLSNGSYQVMSIRKCKSQSHNRLYLLLIDVKGELRSCYSNEYIEKKIEEELDDELKAKTCQPKHGYMTVDNKALAVLEITGWGWSNNHHINVHCKFQFCTVEGDCVATAKTQTTKEIAECEKKLTTNDLATPKSLLPILPETDIIPYKQLINLTSLDIGSSYIVEAIGFVAHYGQQKLVIKLDNGICYQAGEYVEQHTDELLDGCRLIIEKIRTNRNTKKKFAVCKIVQAGDWAGVLDYDKVTLLPKNHPEIKIMDVQTVDVKGQKRKLILTTEGDVYRFKRSKLEDMVKPADVLY